MALKNKIEKTFLHTRIGRKFGNRYLVYKHVTRFMMTSREIKMGEANIDKMQKLVDRQRKKWPKRFDEVDARIDWLCNSPLNLGYSNIDSLRLNMLFSYFAYGFTPSEYLAYNLAGKSITERNEYISDRESVVYAYRLNSLNGIELFMDKRKTYKLLKDYYQRELIEINRQEDFEEFRKFVKKHPVFVKKDAKESCGRGVERIDILDNNRDYTASMEMFECMLNEKDIILEEPINQSEELSRINSSTVNTVRCITLQTKNGIVIPWCFGKLGRAGAFIDNGAAGGLLAGIDVDTGMIIDNSCCDELGQRYHEHPDNGMILDGFQYPQWTAMKTICIDMASKVNGAKWIGWDMAHTDNGWVVVEGNSVTELIGPQSTLRRGIRSELNNLLMDH